MEQLTCFFLFYFFIHFIFFFYSQNAIKGRKRASFKRCMTKQSEIFFYEFWFLRILILGVTWLIVCIRAKFVYLFRDSQCVLSYHRSRLGTENINRLRFHLSTKTKWQVSLVICSPLVLERNGMKPKLRNTQYIEYSREVLEVIIGKSSKHVLLNVFKSTGQSLSARQP